MSGRWKQVILAALLAAWMAIAWPHLSEQFSTSEQARAALGPLSWEERTAAVDEPGYRVAHSIANIIPARGRVVVLSYTGPEHLRYYRARFPYYLYPRQVRLTDRSEEGGGCEYLAVFRDTAQNLAQEPFHGHWDEHQLAERTAAMTRVYAAADVQIFRAR